MKTMKMFPNYSLLTMTVSTTSVSPSGSARRSERLAPARPERKEKKKRRPPTRSNFMKRNAETRALERLTPEEST